MSRLISKMSTMKKETNIKVEFITFYKFCVTETYMLIIECNGNTQSGDTIYLESHNICIKGQESYYFYDNTGLFGTLTIADSIEKAKDYLYNYFSKQNIKVNITI